MRNKKLKTLLLSTVALAISATVHADLTTDLVAYYPFTGNASDANGNCMNLQ